MDIFHVLFYVPVFNLLMWLTQNIGSIGLAIIVIAGVTKLVTYPLTKGQIEQGKKSKELQAQVKAVQKKYKYNQELMTKELAKVQAKALPGQLKGCISIIVFIIFFIQIRGTIVDLVNRGYHAFNTVAYSESLKRDEDSIKFVLTDNLPIGANTLKISVEASNGAKLEKVYDFEIVGDVNKRIEEIKTQELDKSENQRKAEADVFEKAFNAERATDIAIYNDKFEAGLKSIAIKSFLIFPTESVRKYLMSSGTGSFDFYLRPPSGYTLLAEKTQVELNGINITGEAVITQGESFNLEFLGMNLARVAVDFDIFNFKVTAPYIALALLSAFTQYLVSKIYSATTVSTEPSKDLVKKDDVDMSTAMADSLQTTNKLLPIFTFVLSLGYLGGATFLPTGVTLFWTAQNVFVIIQQSFMNRVELVKKSKDRFARFQSRFIKVNNSNNGSK